MMQGELRLELGRRYLFGEKGFPRSVFTDHFTEKIAELSPDHWQYILDDDLVTITIDFPGEDQEKTLTIQSKTRSYEVIVKPTSITKKRKTRPLPAVA